MPLLFPLLVPLCALSLPASANGRELPRTATPLREDDVGRLLREAHRQLFGVTPGPERLLGAWAHVELETARGAQCEENNLGNLTVSADWSGDFAVVTVLERVPRHPSRWKEQKIRFRSYETPLEGAVDYWRVLSGRFGSALRKMDDGDGLGAGARLCAAGYSTAECSGYASGLSGLYARLRTRWLHRIADLEPTPESEITCGEWEAIERESGLAACVVETPVVAVTSPSAPDPTSR